MEHHVSIAILAGGQSTRMGQDKASLPWGNQDILNHLLTLMQRDYQDIIVISNTPRALPPGILGITDIIPQCGPLSGIHAGLTYAKNPVCFVLSCDMPFVVPDIIPHLLKAGEGQPYDAIIPCYQRKQQPLPGCYRKTALHPIEKALTESSYRVSALLAILSTVYVEAESWPPDLHLERLFSNINTYEEYQKAYTLLQGGDI